MFPARVEHPMLTAFMDEPVKVDRATRELILSVAPTPFVKARFVVEMVEPVAVD